MNPQILRFINRKRMNEHGKHSDNIHNIQESITYIMSIKPTVINNDLHNLIFNNEVFTLETKNILIEYSDNTYIHSVLHINFQELLLNIYSLILKNENSDVIFERMNNQMNDSLCESFTGRIRRLVNCLNGFDDNIKINIINDIEIENIIILIKNQLLLENKYDLETHKRLVKTSLLERKKKLNIIKEWMEYCE